ncbi:MAG: hypothetical protein HQL39_05990 [Alphaproteobacteria bacterium]|nr:hypothetical protein [Alphaproteobacteria bacterium]
MRRPALAALALVLAAQPAGAATVLELACGDFRQEVTQGSTFFLYGLGLAYEPMWCPAQSKFISVLIPFRAEQYEAARDLAGSDLPDSKPVSELAQEVAQHLGRMGRADMTVGDLRAIMARVAKPNGATYDAPACPEPMTPYQDFAKGGRPFPGCGGGFTVTKRPIEID